jgi:head-tail adaptor
MRAGQLRLVGMLEERTRAKDQLGGQPWAWLPVASVRFGIETTGGDEQQVAGGVVATSRYTISMRWRKGVKPTMRISMGDRVFQFIQVNNVEERNRELQIIAIEGMNEKLDAAANRA